MFKYYFLDRGVEVEVWTQSSAVEFLRPAAHDAYFEIELSKETLGRVSRELQETGKSTPVVEFDFKGKDGTVYAHARNGVYLRLPRSKSSPT